MKRNIYFMMIAAITLLVASCGSGDVWEDSNDNMTPGTGGSTSAGTTTTTGGDLDKLTIAIDSTTALTENESVPSDDEDYVENSDFTSKISIAYSGSSATVTGSATGVTVTTSGADVTVKSTAKNIEYVLSGSTADGSFKVYSDKKYKVTLNGVNIKNNDGPAFNDQSGKRVFMVLSSGSFNSFTDGTSYASSSEDQKGTIFSEGKLIFSGAGKLRVYANTKAGISADDYVMIRPNTNIYIKATAGNGIKANDAVTVNGGIVNIETSATASKGISSDSLVNINGGRTIILTTGGGEYDSDENDASACSGVKSDYDFTIKGGELQCMSSGAGGKGISSDKQIIINDGTVKVITTGKTYNYSQNIDSKAKGIKSDGNMEINGGSVMVKATGSDGSEGIESKGTLKITGGTVEAYAYDDAINSASHMYIQGGYIYAFGMYNDGLDSNGNMYIQGGTTVAYGTSSPECGIDANEEGGYHVIITGGTLVGIGGGTSYPSSSSTQPAIVYGGSVSSGTTLALNSSSANVLTFKMGRTYGGNAVILFTSPSLKKGSSYTLYSGATATGTDWHGLITSASVSSTGSSAGSVSSLSSPYSSIGNTSGGMGGMGGGGGR
jgi:hypothetical protein